MSTTRGGDYKRLNGTSTAGPYVAGLAALILDFSPQLNFKDVREAILNSVDVLPTLQDLVASGGRINAKKALQHFLPPTATDNTMLIIALSTTLAALLGFLLLIYVFYRSRRSDPSSRRISSWFTPKFAHKFDEEQPSPGQRQDTGVATVIAPMERIPPPTWQWTSSSNLRSLGVDRSKEWTGEAKDDQKHVDSDLVGINLDGFTPCKPAREVEGGPPPGDSPLRQQICASQLHERDNPRGRSALTANTPTSFALHPQTPTSRTQDERSLSGRSSSHCHSRDSSSHVVCSDGLDSSPAGRSRRGDLVEDDASGLGMPETFVHEKPGHEAFSAQSSPLARDGSMSHRSYTETFSLDIYPRGGESHGRKPTATEGSTVEVHSEPDQGNEECCDGVDARREKSEDGFDKVGIAFIDLTGETTSEEADSDSDAEIQKFEL